VTFRLVGLLLTFLLSAAAASAQTFPTKPVTLVVPYAPGGNSDIVGRAIAQKLGEHWNQPVVVENRPGATTTVGAAYAAKAAPDGYTLLLAAPPFVITQYVYPDLSYDTRKSFEPVSLIAYFPLVLVVPAALPVNNLKELVAHARANPGVTYASPGAGTTSHLIGEMLAKEEKLDLVHIPYKSGGQGVVDLMGGRIGFYGAVPPEVMSQIRAGKLKALAVLADKRSDLLPDVPTSAESGFPYLQAQSWSSISAPKGTPQAVVAKISGDIAQVIKDPSLRERLSQQGAVFVGSTPAELAAWYEEEHKRWGPLVKSIGVAPGQ
jgi:tripartite-type tricarboxylate transporter receptor subunit TctC